MSKHTGSSFQSSQPCLFLFDFDHTVIRCNSDEEIPKLMKAHEACATIERGKGRTPWTRLMDEAVVAAQRVDGKTLEDFDEATRQMPMYPELLRVLEYCARRDSTHIISDANTRYIDVFLRSKRELEAAALVVHSNPGVISEGDGILRVLPYQHESDPHGCTLCPVNMCKTIIVNKILAQFETRPRCFYFGDGQGDWCPALRALNANDVVFARDDSSEPKARGLVKCMERHGSPIEAQVLRWASGSDLQTQFEHALGVEL